MKASIIDFNLSEDRQTQKLESFLDTIDEHIEFCFEPGSSPQKGSLFQKENNDSLEFNFASDQDIHVFSFMCTQNPDHILRIRDEEDNQFSPSVKDEYRVLQFEEASSLKSEKSQLEKRPPSNEADEEDQDSCSSDQGSSGNESKKRSFLRNIRNCVQTRNEFTPLMQRLETEWPKMISRSSKFIGLVRDCIQSIYLRHTFVSPQQVNDPFIELILHQLYSIILPSYNHSQPTAADPRAGKHHRLVVMELKRSDQYVKKFWSKVKVLIYGKFKDGPTKRADALDSLSEKFGFKPEDNKTFENLFGSNVKHGLKKSTIEFILTRPNLFKQIFTKKVFEHALDQMEKGSALDCETNIISKIEKCCEEKTLGQAIRVLESHISEERKFKKPFSVMENTLAALQFLDKFIKRAERWKGLTQERSNQLMKTLLDLKTGLESTLKNNRWVVPFKHRKAEIISFLRID